MPAQFRVLVTIRPRYACPKGRSGVVQAKAPPALIEGGLPTEALLAHVCVFHGIRPLVPATSDQLLQ